MKKNNCNVMPSQVSFINFEFFSHFLYTNGNVNKISDFKTRHSMNDLNIYNYLLFYKQNVYICFFLINKIIFLF